jgi:hypothetical protein
MHTGAPLCRRYSAPLAALTIRGAAIIAI